MTDNDELRDEILGCVERFRKQWIHEGDDYPQDDVADDILELFQSHHNKLLSDLVGNIKDMYNPSPEDIHNRERHEHPNEVVYVDEVTALLMGKIK